MHVWGGKVLPSLNLRLTSCLCLCLAPWHCSHVVMVSHLFLALFCYDTSCRKLRRPLRLHPVWVVQVAVESAVLGDAMCALAYVRT